MFLKIHETFYFNIRKYTTQSLAFFENYVMIGKKFYKLDKIIPRTN